MSVACQKTYKIIVAPNCLQCDQVFLHAYLNNVGGSFNGQLILQPDGTYTATDNIGSSYLIQKTGGIWQFTIVNAGTQYSANGPPSSGDPQGQYTATINNFAGVPNQITFLNCGSNVGRLMYWSYDLVQFTSFRDNFLNVPETPSFAPAVNYVPGLIGMAEQFVHAGSSLQASLNLNPQLLKYAQQGVSHDFWARMDVEQGATPMEIVATLMDGDDGHQYEFSMRPGLGGVYDNIPFEVIRDPGNPMTVTTVLSAVIPITWVAGAWNFFSLLYDQASGTVSASVNNGTPNISASSYAIPTGTWNRIFIAPTQAGGDAAFPHMTIDEYMIHTGKTLNPTQVTGLYNGGSGVTWPAAGTIVS